RFLRRGIGIARVFERKTTDHYLKSRCTAEDGLGFTEQKDTKESLRVVAPSLSDMEDKEPIFTN
ncbi:MAG: hypothetical protein QM300_10430, partial [Pseudomonadota bacterium]|nr:hypothetical protein [Pseudomonadota bacterium]